VDALNLRRLVRGRDAGSELIELAIVMPILVLLLLGIVDFAFLFQRWEVVTNAAREGARLGSLASADTPGGYVANDVTTRVTNYLTSSGLQATPTVGTDFDTTDDVNGVIVQTVTVSVSYPSDFIFLPGSITLNSSAEMRSENEQ
jgi:Flp pilus assembly protein TadG